MRTLDYRGFLIIIEKLDYKDEKTGEVIFKRYLVSVESVTKNLPFGWSKNFNRDVCKIDDIIAEAKFHIDEYLNNGDKYKITLTLRTRVKPPEKIMRFLFEDIKDALGGYDVVKLEKIEAFNIDKVPIYGEYIK